MKFFLKLLFLMLVMFDLFLFVFIFQIMSLLDMFNLLGLKVLELLGI